MPLQAHGGPPLTERLIARTLLLFALPILGNTVLQSLNASVNVMWIGHCLGEAALTATSNATLVLFLLLSAVFGVSMACTILVGQGLGAQRVGGQARDGYRRRLLHRDLAGPGGGGFLRHAMDAARDGHAGRRPASCDRLPAHHLNRAAGGVFLSFLIKNRAPGKKTRARLEKSLHKTKRPSLETGTPQFGAQECRTGDEKHQSGSIADYQSELPNKLFLFHSD